jgi:hypothetical protein
MTHLLSSSYGRNTGGRSQNSYHHCTYAGQAIALSTKNAIQYKLMEDLGFGKRGVSAIAEVVVGV